MQALAAAMAHDYHAIVEAGFALQLDCPELVMEKQLHLLMPPWPRSGHTAVSFPFYSGASVAIGSM